MASFCEKVSSHKVHRVWFPRGTLVGSGSPVRKQPPKQLKTLENLLQQAEHYSEYMMTGISGSVPPTLMARMVSAETIRAMSVGGTEPEMPVIMYSE